MGDQLINFETAKLAKEKGFKEPVYYYFQKPVGSKYFSEALDTELEEEAIFISINDVNPEDCNSGDDFPNRYYSRPTQSLLQKWLREEHKIHIDIQYSFNYNKFCYFVYNNSQIRILAELLFLESDTEKYLKYNTYEDALTEALLEGLSLIPNKNE